MAAYEYEAMGELAWQLACSRLAERGAHVLESAQWSDCVLAVGRERREVRAHRLLLAMASPVLAHLLYVEWSPERPGPVPVPDVELDVFHAMLVYIYTDRVEIASHGAARELYYAAQRFALPHLVAACSAHLAATLSPDNVCAALQVVEVLGDDERLDAPLREQCLQLMRSDTAQVLSASGFLSARPSTVETLFALEPLEIRSEMELFRAAERYVAHRTSARDGAGGAEEANLEAQEKVKEMLRGALQQIRFLTVEPSEFAEYDTSMLLSVPEQLAIALNLHSVNTRHAMPSGFSTSRTHRRTDQLEREAAERQRKEDEERLRKEEEERKRKREAEAEKQRQEAANREAEQRMVGLGARDPLRPAARVRLPPVSLRALTSTGRPFKSDEFFVRGMRWRVWCNPPWTPLDPTHLYVTIGCFGPSDSEERRRGWRCAARGHVRVLQGGSAGEAEVEGRRRAYDHTFTKEDCFVSWEEFMSRDALQALAPAPPRRVPAARDVTDQLILEVELAADPPEYTSEHSCVKFILN